MTPEQRIKFEKDVLNQMGYQDEAERVAGQPDVMSAMVKPYEMVNQPKHYDFFGMKAIDIIEKTLNWEEYIGFLKGTAMRYRLRAGSKPGNTIEQDMAKAEWYENEYDECIRKNTP